MLSNHLFLSEWHLLVAQTFKIDTLLFFVTIRIGGYLSNALLNVPNSYLSLAQVIAHCRSFKKCFLGALGLDIFLLVEGQL
jgi:hypothetical protein